MESLKASSNLFVTKYRKWDTRTFNHNPNIHIFKPPTKQINVRFSLPNKKIHHIYSLSSPNSQGEFDSEELENEDINESRTVHVKFQLQRECLFGEQYLIVGEDPMLGLWDPSNAVPLNWTDGHLWVLEMSGPDRTLETWETEKTITVCEDWDSAELQKLIEEEPNSNHYEGSTTAPIMVTIDGLEMPNSENPVMAMVAENITDPKEKSLVNTLCANNTADTNNGNDGRSVNKKDMESKKYEVVLVESYSGVPVLVPGLTALDDHKESTNEVQTDIFVDALSEVEEAKEINVPEFIGNVIQLHDKEEHEQKLRTLQIEKQPEPSDNAVAENDMEWGRRTLQKFLSNFGIQ